MCEVTSDGYKMNDGKFIKFTDDMRKVSPKHIKELSENTMTAWDGFLIHQSIVCLEKKILPALQKIDGHTEDCPINKNGIKGIVLEEIKKFGKTKWTNFFGKARDISIILTMVTTIIFLVKQIT